MARLSQGRFSLETDAVRVDVLHGLELVSLKAYCKQVIGPPALTAENVSVTIDPLALLARRPCVQALRISKGVIRPGMTRGPRPAPRQPRKDWESRFELQLVNCRLRGVMIELLSCDMRVRHGWWGAQAIDATLTRADMRGFLRGATDYEAETRMLRGHMATHLDPHMLLPWFDAWNMPFATRLVRRFEFGASAPRCEADFSRACEPGGRFDAKGRFWLRNSTYRGVHLLRADADIEIHNDGPRGTVSLDPLLVVRPEGVAKVAFTVDRGRQETVFEGDSAIDPKAITKLIGVLTNGELERFTFDGPSFVRARGKVDFGHSIGTDLNVSVEGRRMHFDRLQAEDYTFGIRMRGMTNRIEDFKARFCEGVLTGKADFSADPATFTNAVYKVFLRVADAESSKFVEALGGRVDNEYRGRLSGFVRAGGPPGGNVFDTMAGHGRVSVRHGRIFSLPLFGGLSRIMTAVIPGLHFVLRQTDAETSFTIEDGKMHTDEIHIKGDVLSLSGYGDYHFDGHLDFWARVTLMKEHTLVAKLLKPLVYPISKLFEFRLRGTLGDPHWYPVNFSREMLERIGLRKRSEIPDQDIRLPDE